MVQYSGLRKWEDETAKLRAIKNLKSLRKALFKDIKRKRDVGSVLLASWNLRDFDSNKFGHGPRLEESYLYLAEIISAFDLVALQEINRDLKPLKKLMARLGRRDWDYIVTDTTEGRGGNQERMAFVFNRHRISFANMAGEVVLPGTDTRQFARTPFVAAFQAGWFKFNLCTVHMYFGTGTTGKKKRVKEIENLAKFFSKRQDKETEDYILLGDFNIVGEDDDTMKALLDNDYTMPAQIMTVGTTLKGEHPYDQIALKVKNKMLELGDAGVFDFEKYVFRDNEFKAYTPYISEKSKTSAIKQVRDRERRKAAKAGRPFTFTAADEKQAFEDYYKKVWRSFQLSDHKPIWVEMKVDFTEDYLDSLKPDEVPLANLPD